ncbi:MAG: IS3 family transposase [Chloroflexi bacterium]|nr:IS3 family transposase [Chloroflexota bacterium]
MTRFCESIMITRQNAYQNYIHCDEEKLNQKEVIKNTILIILEEHPGWSGVQILKELRSHGLKIGRDRFYKIVNANKMTLNSRRKAWKKRRVKVKPAINLIINHTFRRVFEVLLSDYTEIETEEGKLQLLIMEDLVSRCIITYKISATCTSAPVVVALEESMAVKASLKLRYKTIFHTDQGSEFVNHAVQQVAAKHDLSLSNTGSYRCYENSFIESLNRTLKHSFGLRVKFASKVEAVQYIDAAINRYNTEHLHSSIGKRTPYSVLIGYTGKNPGKPEVKERSCPLPGQGARIYSKALIVKVKKIKLDKKKTQRK